MNELLPTVLHTKVFSRFEEENLLKVDSTARKQESFAGNTNATGAAELNFTSKPILTFYGRFASFKGFGRNPY